MAYFDYTTLHKLNNELGITHKRQKLFMKINPILPSAKLTEDLQEARDYYSLTTEKAKSEFLMLQNLLTAFLPHYRITNEPRRIACGTPAFEIAKDDVPIGHVSG